MKKNINRTIRTNNYTKELIESLIEFKPKDNQYRKTKKLIESLKKEEIEEYTSAIFLLRKIAYP